VKEKKLIKDGISHTAIRDILIEYGVEWRQSKTVLGKIENPDYDLKKRIEELKHNTSEGSILLFQDEKGPIAAKTYGGSSWSSTQAKIAVERVGICDYTNGRMLTHCYQQKKSNQFIDFIERVDSFYDLNTKRIFLVLYNAVIHKSKKTKETLSKQHHPIMTLVFLPTKSPKLNLIEVRWMWLQRKAINNSTFRNQSDIG